MNGFKAYRYYLALKLHFTKEKFNVFENRGNLKISVDTFKARNDSYLFEKLAKKFDKDQDYIQFVVANFAYGNPNVVWDDGLAVSNYMQWIKVKESITRTFTDDINKAFFMSEKNGLDPANIINCTNNEIPYIIKLYLGKTIQPQTVCILNDIIGCIDPWLSDPTVNMLFEDELLRIKKLKGFFSYDKEKLERIYRSYCGDV